MEPFTIILIIFAVFVGFLMLTSGHRKHRLNQALAELEAERMRLMKSIEHVKLSFYQQKLGEKDAQDHIFSLEEKLRSIESRILDIKEKPLMRTLKKQEEEVKSEVQKETEVLNEKVDARQGQRFLLERFDAKTIVIFFIVLVIALMIVMGTMSTKPASAEKEIIPDEPVEIELTAQTVPTQGTSPGSSAGLRVGLSNTYDEDLNKVVVDVRVPEGSGITFEGEEIEIIQIPVLERGGSRELSFYMTLRSDVPEGEYVLKVHVYNSEGLDMETSAKLIVRVGLGEEDV